MLRWVKENENKERRSDVEESWSNIKRDKGTTKKGRRRREALKV